MNRFRIPFDITHGVIVEKNGALVYRPFENRMSALFIEMKRASKTFDDAAGDEVVVDADVRRRVMEALGMLGIVATRDRAPKEHVRRAARLLLTRSRKPSTRKPKARP